jgi:hypothetical protein
LQSVLERLTGVTGVSHRPPTPGCTVNATIDLGDLWSMLVLRDVIFGNGATSPSCSRAAEEGIASNQPRS